MKWKLKRTRQCKKCPWRVDVNPREIPNGYCVEKHKNLESTIAKDKSINPCLRIMSCHETGYAHCVGWLHNQLGTGNNIPLRISMLSCSNSSDIKVIGEQHRSFKDTLPGE